MNLSQGSGGQEDFVQGHTPRDTQIPLSLGAINACSLVIA